MHWAETFNRIDNNADLVSEARRVVLVARVTEAVAVMLVLYASHRDDKVRLWSSWKAVHTKYVQAGVQFPGWLQKKFSVASKFR